MKRIIYYGTKNGLGHHASPLSYNLSAESVTKAEQIDCEPFHKLLKNNKLTPFKYGIYTCFGYPASVDDCRDGSITVILVEGECSKDEFLNIIHNDYFLSMTFNAIERMFDVNMNNSNP